MIDSAQGQIDFFGRSLTGQSPNSLNTYVVAGIANETSIVRNRANLTEFDHATRQINLFNLGIDYAAEILGTELEEVQINLDTMIGGELWRNGFRFYTGMQYEMWDRQTESIGIIGSSRFRKGGLCFAVRHEMSLLPSHLMIQVAPANAVDQSLFFSVFAGFEAGFDTGFSISLDESGILQVVTDHLVRDVAEGNLTFDEYKFIETRLHESLRYDAPSNTGGSEWYFLALLKGELFTTPFAYVPLKFSLGLDVGVDLGRLRKRNQNRIGLTFKLGYLLY